MTINTKMLKRTALAALLSPMLAAAAPMYQIQAISDIGGDSGDLADINNAGHIVGYALTKAHTVSGYLAVDGISSSVRPPGVTASNASGINDRGQISGYVTENGATRAVIFNGENVTSLGSLGGDSYGARINPLGQVAGTANLGDNITQHAFRYTPGAGMQDLGTLGGPNSAGNDIDRRGTVVGQSDVASGSYHAFAYTFGKMHDLGTLGGNFSSAAALNDRGQVVGTSYLAGDAYAHAFLFQDGVMNDLSTLGGPNSYAMGINNLGQVVGQSEVGGGGSTHAFLWSNGTMVDLNSLIQPEFEFVLRYAADINDKGQIAALGCTASGIVCQGFMLSLADVPPVPEPQTWAMMAFGGVLMALAARRRRGS